ncbi:MAG TPA: glycosyltransferase family 2 protein [Candidatus Angelobacter sp.]|nr:glycosyltransferase family 2 protein [Candidatus Angelobacter sp.]
MNLLSACIITFNEEQNLPRALASLAEVADEIVIVDSGSADRTEQIAREYGAVFLSRPWTNYAEQKNFAAESARNDWILSLDADEELSSPLKTSVLEWKKRPADLSVYEMARRAWYLGKWIRYSGWYPDFQRRLYRRDLAKFSGIIHESLQFEGRPGRLRGDLLHYTVRSFDEHEEKVERYTALAAQRLYVEGKRSWRPAIWFAAPWSWFQNYFLRGGFLDGYQGAQIARMAARSVRLKYRKLGQLVEEAAKRNPS